MDDLNDSVLITDHGTVQECEAPWPRCVPMLVWRMLLIAGGCLLAMQLLFGAYLVVWGVPGWRGEELNVLFVVQAVLHGGQAYVESHMPPYDFVQYPPLTYWLYDGVSRLAGLDGTDVESTVQVARFVNVGLYVGMLVALASFARTRFRTPATLIVILLAYFGWAVMPWAYLLRPDGLLLLFTGLALMTVVWGLQEGSERRRLLAFGLAAALGVMAGFAKQNGLQVVGITGLYCLLTRRWRAFGVVAVTGVAVGLAVVALAIGAYGYDALYDNLVVGVQNGIDVWNYRNKTLGNFIPRHAPLLATLVFVGIAVVQLTSAGIAAQRSRDVTVFLLLASLALFLVAIVLGLKAGSAENYFNEFTVCVTLLLLKLGGDVWMWLESGRDGLQRRTQPWVCAALIGAVCWPLTVGAWTAAEKIDLVRDVVPVEQEIASRAIVVQYLREQLEHDPALIYSTDRWTKILMAENAVAMMTDVHRQNILAGRGDLEPLRVALRHGAVKILVGEQILSAWQTDIVGDDIGRYYPTYTYVGSSYVYFRQDYDPGPVPAKYDAVIRTSSPTTPAAG